MPAKGADAVAPDADAIPDSLLEAIPDLNGDAPAPEEPPAQPMTEADLHVMLADARKHLDSVFINGMARVEEALSESLRDMEARLQRASDELIRLHQATERLRKQKARYDQKFGALKDLALDD